MCQEECGWQFDALRCNLNEQKKIQNSMEISLETHHQYVKKENGQELTDTNN